MSSTKLRKRPIAEQIAEYEREIKRIEVHINNGKERIKELQRHIRILQKPDAEANYQRRMAQYNRQQQKEQELAQRRERMAREVEECLRMNGKTV